MCRIWSYSAVQGFQMAENSEVHMQSTDTVFNCIISLIDKLSHYVYILPHPR